MTVRTRVNEMNREVRSILRELRRRFEAIYGDRLVKMILFGSQARGDAEPGSDIDVLVVLRGDVSPCEEIERTLDDVVEMLLRRGHAVACVFVSAEEYERERSPLMLNVWREGVPV
jgi:predicted nucleotidyltransferase